MNNYIQETTNYYNKKFTHNNYAVTESDLLRWNSIENALIQLLPKIHSTPTILDFGCGEGWLSSYLSKYGIVTGIDISNQSIEAAKQKYSQIKFLHLDASSSNQIETLIQTKFDIIVSSEVIEHIVSQDIYIDNISKLLKTNGFLIMTTPNGKWKNHYFFGDRVNWGQPYELWMTKETLRNNIKKKFKEHSINTFGSLWLFSIKSYGLPNLLGHKIVRKLIEVFNAKKIYELVLNKIGFGLYLVIIGRK